MCQQLHVEKSCSDDDYSMAVKTVSTYSLALSGWCTVNALPKLISVRISTNILIEKNTVYQVEVNCILPGVHKGEGAYKLHICNNNIEK